MNEEPSMNAANRVPSQPNLHPAHTSLMYFVDARNSLRLHYHFRSFLGLISVLLFWLKLMKHWCHCANIVSNEETISYFCTSVWFGFCVCSFSSFPIDKCLYTRTRYFICEQLQTILYRTQISLTRIYFSPLWLLFSSLSLSHSLTRCFRFDDGISLFDRNKQYRFQKWAGTVSIIIISWHDYFVRIVLKSWQQFTTINDENERFTRKNVSSLFD